VPTEEVKVTPLDVVIPQTEPKSTGEEPVKPPRAKRESSTVDPVAVLLSLSSRVESLEKKDAEKSVVESPLDEPDEPDDGEDDAIPSWIRSPLGGD
jgi:hypothetical protein